MGEKKQPGPREEEMKRLADEGLTFVEIGKRFGISRERVRQLMKKYWGLTAKDFSAIRPVGLFRYQCHQCGLRFYKRQRASKVHRCLFCCSQCSGDFVFKIWTKKYINSPHRLYPAYNRPRPILKFKYVGMKNGKQIIALEHRYKLEQCLGRKLRSDEFVEFVDGNTQNTDPSNLHIFSRKEHYQRLKKHRREVNLVLKQLSPICLGKVLIKKELVKEYLKKN